MRNRLNDRRKLLTVFNVLLKEYGKRHWWPGKTRFEVVAGAILTQNVSWRNVKTAIKSLKKARLLSPKAILKSTDSKLARLIISTRFYNQKAQTLKAFCKMLSDKYGGSLDKLFSPGKPVDALRKELLSVKGIGRETADSILLYAGGKLSFVSDAYTSRFLGRTGLFKVKDTYDHIRNFFMKNLPEDLYIYNEFHALIVRHGNSTCKTKPECTKCVMKKPVRGIACKYAVRA